MNAREKADHLLGSISETLSMKEPLKLDQNDTCVFTVDGRYVFMVQFEGESEHLLLNLPLGVLPDGDEGKELALELLAGNYCWGLTAGGTLGLDDENGIVSLCYGYDVSEGRGGGFEEVLGDLAGAAEYWMGKLGTLDEEDAPTAPTGGGGNMIRA